MFQECSEEAQEDHPGPHERDLEALLGVERHEADAARGTHHLGDDHHDEGERQRDPHAREDLRCRRRQLDLEDPLPARRRNVRATSSSPRSMPRTPSIVFSRIGNMQTNPMSQIFGALPMPISVMETGTRPVAGIDRANCTVGWNARSSSRSRPEQHPEEDPQEHGQQIAQAEPDEARHDVRAHAREQPRVLERREDRRQRRIEGGGAVGRQHPPEDDEDDRDDQRDADDPRPFGDGHVFTTRWETCQRSSRFSVRSSTALSSSPRMPDTSSRPYMAS